MSNRIEDKAVKIIYRNYTDEELIKMIEELGYKEPFQYVGGGIYKIMINDKFGFYCSTEGVIEFDRVMREKCKELC